jgi:UDP-N-acetylmuramyl pentapeptide synthase
LAILDIVNYKEGKQSIFDKFNELFLEYKLQSGRLSVFNGINDSIIFDSTYNSSPLSVKKILNTVHNIKKDLFPYREVWVML